jgi:hypothetical protein
LKALEVSRNGVKLFTAGLEYGIVTAKFVLRNQVDPVWLNVDGRDQTTGGHQRWAHLAIALGDEFTVRLVDCNAVDVDANRD